MVGLGALVVVSDMKFWVSPYSFRLEHPSGWDHAQCSPRTSACPSIFFVPYSITPSVFQPAFSISALVLTLIATAVSCEVEARFRPGLASTSLH